MDDSIVTENEISKFLATVGAELEGHSRFMQLHAATLAPGFNFFNYLYPDENRLSNVLSKLLDPNGGHGQGALFLSSFLQILSKKYPKSGAFHRILSLSPEELCLYAGRPEVEVSTSQIENNKRRIDVLQSFCDSDRTIYGLAIENKPWAEDQPAQVTEYNEHLKQIFNKHYLQIYLSGSGQAPSEDSITSAERELLEKAGQLQVMPYSELIEWAQNCAEKCQSHRLRCFLEDFATYIKEQFVGGTTMINEEIIKKQALKPENIASAFAIGSCWPSIANALIDKLCELTKEKLGNEWCVEVDFDWNKNYSRFLFYKNGWHKFRFGFEFDQSNAKNLFYGVRKTDVTNELNFSEIGKEKGKSSDWWPWYQYVTEEDFKNWNSTSVPWAEIKENGKTIAFVSEKLEKLQGYFCQQIDNLEKK